MIGAFLRADDAATESLARWPGWDDALLLLFAEILARGEAIGEGGSAAAKIEANIEKKRLWFNDLISAGFTPSEILCGIGAAFADANSRERIRATAELSRFTNEIDSSVLAGPNAAALLASDIHRMHQMDPWMGSEEFFGALLQLGQPTTLSSVCAALRRSGIPMTSLSKYGAYLKLVWHAADPQDFLREMTRLVRRNVTFRSLDALCRARLGVGSDAFFAKIQKLGASGADLQPLIFAIEKKFPGSMNVDMGYRDDVSENDGRRMAASAVEPESDEQSYETSAADGGGENLIEGAQLMLPGLASGIGSMK